MKKIVLTVIMFCVAIGIASAQVTMAETADDVAKATNPDGWKLGGTSTLTFNQVGLKNWAAGGSPSIGLLGLINGYADLKRGKNLFQSRLAIEYGMQKLRKEPFRKSADRIELFTKYGYRISNKWYVSTYANLRTQLTKTKNFAVADTITPPVISRFASPLFAEGALGLDYVPNQYFSMFLSPVAAKMTIVANDEIAALNLHGNDFKNFRGEFGATAIFTYKQEVVKNVNVFSVLKIYKDYLKGPAQNIDIDWQTTIGLKVTNYITANVFTHLIYDYDVLIPTDKNENGIADDRGVQFRDVIGVGFAYNVNKVIERKVPANVD